MGCSDDALNRKGVWDYNVVRWCRFTPLREEGKPGHRWRTTCLCVATGARYSAEGDTMDASAENCFNAWKDDAPVRDIIGELF